MIIISYGFLLLALIASIISTTGVVIIHSKFNRLHFMGPITVVGCLALFLAVAFHEGISQITGKVAVAVFILMATGPVITHAMARGSLNRGDAREFINDEWEVNE